MAGNSEATRLRDVVRSKDPMYALCKERLITPEACDWVKSALDPFHDLQLDNLRGYPDVSTEPTVIVKVRQAIAITKPPGLAEGANWDCHIVTSPIDFSPAIRSTVHGAIVYPHGTQDGTNVQGGIGNPAGMVRTTSQRCARLDGLLINSVPSSAIEDGNMTYTPGHCPETAAGGYQLQNLKLDDYLDYETTDLGVYRLVYSGFEVVNTTAQIYKQGAVTVYEYGNSFEMGATLSERIGTEVGDTGISKTPITQPATFFRCPPNTLAEAKIMPGSHSWAAQDGSYNTSKFQSTNNFQSATRRPFVVCQNNTQAATGSGYGGGTAGSFVSDIYSGYVGLETSTAADLSNYSGPAHFSQMNTTGAYFTGLSEQTTLFVTWRVGIERLPAANKPTFLALSQPSATYDPNALVLYNLVANVLPPGCPQGYNDAGKWFRWISEAAQKSIPAVYPIIRTAGMLANAMGRPIIGSSLTALGETMRPSAEALAIKRLQKAVRNKQQAKAKAAVSNYSQPTPRGTRAGGTNGLR